MFYLVACYCAARSVLVTAHISNLEVNNWFKNNGASGLTFGYVMGGHPFGTAGLRPLLSYGASPFRCAPICHIVHSAYGFAHYPYLKVGGKWGV